MVGTGPRRRLDAGLLAEVAAPVAGGPSAVLGDGVDAGALHNPTPNPFTYSATNPSRSSRLNSCQRSGCGDGRTWMSSDTACGRQDCSSRSSTTLAAC